MTVDDICSVFSSSVQKKTFHWKASNSFQYHVPLFSQAILSNMQNIFCVPLGAFVFWTLASVGDNLFWHFFAHLLLQMKNDGNKFKMHIWESAHNKNKKPNDEGHNNDWILTPLKKKHLYFLNSFYPNRILI